MSSPLHISVVFDSRSEAAFRVAQSLFENLSGRDNYAGLRIPVSFHASDSGEPLAINLKQSKHTLVVFLVERKMTRRALDTDPADAWADRLAELMLSAPPKQGPHAVLPVALDQYAFDLDPNRFELTSFVRLDPVKKEEQPERLLFHVCAGALLLMKNEDVTSDSVHKAPVTLFVSHAKGDLPKEQKGGDNDPVHALLEETATTPVDAWYDANRIPAGGQFKREIEEGVLDCSALIVVVTNSWSSREWCRREVLEAKEARRPMLIVDHITDSKPRWFPYLGNAPTIRWIDRSSARRVLSFAVQEALKYQFHIAALQSEAGANDEVFGTMPELLNVAALEKSCERVLYPDPPLGNEELKELRRIRPTIKFETPLSMLAGEVNSKEGRRIALSLSNAPDSLQYGGSNAHLVALANDLNLFLFLAKFSISYGGSLLRGATENTINYVEQLAGVSRSYSPLAAQLGHSLNHELIHNFVGWPLHWKYTDNDVDRLPKGAKFFRVKPPADIYNASLSISYDEYFDHDLSLDHRYAWCRGMTAMRECMRDKEDICARVALGGKLTHYSSKYPGVLEEILLDMRANRPLYLIGTFGGATRVVLDVLKGGDREELTSDWVRSWDQKFDALKAKHDEQEIEMLTPEELAEEFRMRGSKGLANALNNGLSEEKNDELAHSTEPRRIVQLILQGLKNLFEDAGA